MEEASHSVEEEGIALVVCLDLLSISDNRAQIVLDLVLIFWHHQIWNLTSVEHVVQILQECLSQNLRVSHGEGECSALDTSLEEQFLHELSELGHTVTLDNLNLLVIHAVDVGTKLGE